MAAWHGKVATATVAMLLLPAACGDATDRATRRERPAPARATSTTATARTAPTTPDLEVVARFPGLLLAVGSRIVDVSTGEAHEVVSVPGVELVAPPVAVEGGFVVVTRTIGDEAGNELQVWNAGGSPSGPAIATNVQGVGVSEDGRRVAWSVTPADGMSAEVFEADLATRAVRHRKELPTSARVVGYAGDVVVLSSGDGAEASAATWVPATGSFRRLVRVAGGRSFGNALDAGDGRTMLTEGDGPCPAIVDVHGDGSVANAHIPACADGARPLGAVSLWLQRQYAAVHGNGDQVTLTEFDRSHTWSLDGDVVDVRTVGQSHLVAVVHDAGSRAATRVRYCRHTARSCTDVARAKGDEQVWVVRRSLATRGPASDMRMQIEPSTVAAGETVVLRGDDLCPFARVVIGMERAPGEHDVPVIGRTTADRAGAFSVEIVVGKHTKPGAYSLNAIQEETTDDDAFPCSHFNVTGPLTVRAAPA